MVPARSLLSAHWRYRHGWWLLQQRIGWHLIEICDFFRVDGGSFVEHGGVMDAAGMHHQLSGTSSLSNPGAPSRWHWMELDINGVHGVEITLSKAGNSYNDLPVINWHKVPEASGCNGWLARRVTTVEELEVVLHEVQTRDDGAYIEVKIPKSEMVPLPDDALDVTFKLVTPTP